MEKKRVKNKFGNYECPCCECFTLSEGQSNSFDICEVCFWEDDGIQLDDPNCEGGANQVSLNEARINFKRFRASEAAFIDCVRPPKNDELPDII